MKLPSWHTVLRFRLRTLLLVMAAATIWLAFHAQSARVQRRSAEAIRAYGGWLRYDYQFASDPYSDRFTNDSFDANRESWAPKLLLDVFGVDMFHDVVQVNLTYSDDAGFREDNANPSDTALQHLEGFPDLQVLLLSDTQASDDAMRHVAKLRSLECLMMWDVRNVSDRGVAHLKGLKQLKYIHLTGSKITDESLRVFASLPKITGLSLQFNHFTDEGLRSVAELEDLESLWVCGTPDHRNHITDSGLTRLYGLKKLKELAVQSTEVSVEGVAKFLEHVPNCKVYHPNWPK